MEFPTRWWFSPDNETPPHICLSQHGQHTERKESEVPQSCSTLCDPMDCSLPASSIHGIFQARVLEWVAISFFRRSSQPRDWTQVSCIAGRFFTVWVTREAHMVPQQSFFKGQVKEGVSPKVYHELMHNSLIGWWWSVLRRQIWGFCTCVLVNCSHLVKVLASEIVKKSASDTIV